MFSQRLAEALAAVGLSQAAFASNVGVSTSTVSKWISGLRAPRDRYWPQIEKALGRPRAWFYSNPGAPPAPHAVSRLRQEAEEILARLQRLEAYPLESGLSIRVPVYDEAPVAGGRPPGDVGEWVDLPLSVLNEAAGKDRDKLYALRFPISACVEGKTVQEGVVVVAPDAEIAESDLFACQDAQGEVIALRYRRGLQLGDMTVLGKIVAVCLRP